MADKKSAGKTETEIVDVLRVEIGRVTCCVLYNSGIYHNRLSEKARRELLAPKGRKTALDKLTTAKHDPRAEFRASPYRLGDPAAPTLLAILATAPKKAMMTAALDVPGARKAQIGRLVYVVGDYVPIYGIPKLRMDPVRSADMNRTPDIRTRAFMPRWACRLTLEFALPMIRQQAVLNLLAAAGITSGLGDWRTEKGSGNYGSFRLVDEDDAEFRDVVATGGRDAQMAALSDAEPYDEQSAELLEWYDGEMSSRRLKGTAPTQPAMEARPQ